ncbi:ribosome recycling factor domain-containing protein [Apodospora peruviana]|uniref:Ribosome recycling factor domain-containing protein n=1 Tax=Apodospora peruviana TaxID=516989 RepID=A0AAE0MFG0_9PEZI|nr:ribosome recycling factor domain-containing protein [Apodospora peruviana]
MKSLRAANALLRSSRGSCNGACLQAPLLRDSQIASCSASITTTQSQLSTALYLSHGSPAQHHRSFSQTTRNYKRPPKNKEPAEDAAPATKRRGNKGRESYDEVATKNSNKSAKSEAGPATEKITGPQPDPEQPFELADLTYAFDKADQHHVEELKKLRTGARFNAEVIGAIPVNPDKKNSSISFPLRELATVAPLGGRKWSILSFEEASVKPIMSAIQKSDEFNQQPQRSEDNLLELTISVEPERADALAKRVKDTCLAWRNKIRALSHKRETVNKRWRAEGAIVDDDLQKLKQKVQKMQEDRMKVVAQREKEALQHVQSRSG